MKITSTTHVGAAKPPMHVNAKKDAQALPFGANVRDTDATAEADGGHARLDAFAQKIESRFEKALSSQDLTKRQRDALEKQRDQFHTMLGRFEKAYLEGGESTARGAVHGMQNLLQHFSASVNHILGTDAPKDADDAHRTRATGHGTQSTLSDELETRGGGIDAVG